MLFFIFSHLIPRCSLERLKTGLLLFVLTGHALAATANPGESALLARRKYLSKKRSNPVIPDGIPERKARNIFLLKWTYRFLK